METVTTIIENDTAIGFLSSDYLAFLKPEDLNDKLIFIKILMFVREIDMSNDTLQAKETFDILVGLMQSNARLEKNPVLFRDYFSLLTILKANFLSLLDLSVIEEFIRESALGCLSISLFSFKEYEFSFNLQDKIRLFLKYNLWYFDQEEQGQVKQVLVKALEHNIEFLGSDRISINEKEPQQVDQSMANWLRVYNESAHPAYGGGRTSFDRLKFLNSNFAIRQLNIQQKNLLEHYIALYDWIRFDWQRDLKDQKILERLDILADEFEEIPTEAQSMQVRKNENLYENRASLEQPLVPAPKNQLIQKPIQEIVKLVPPPASLAKPIAKPVNIEEVMKKKPMEEAFVAPGLKMWNSNPPQMGQNNNNKAVDIDKKLEDLEKRITPVK